MLVYMLVMFACVGGSCSSYIGGDEPVIFQDLGHCEKFTQGATIDAAGDTQVTRFKFRCIEEIEF